MTRCERGREARPSVSLCDVRRSRLKADPAQVQIQGEEIKACYSSLSRMSAIARKGCGVEDVGRNPTAPKVGDRHSDLGYATGGLWAPNDATVADPGGVGGVTCATSLRGSELS